MSSLKEAEDATQKLVRASKSNTESQEYLEAIAMYSRLKFYRHFFQALLFLTKQDLPNGLRHISCAKEQISTMSETINIGVETKGEVFSRKYRTQFLKKRKSSDQKNS